MADRYLIVFAVRKWDDVPSVKELIRNRVKRLKPRFCPTGPNFCDPNPGLDIRVHVTCSWRTIIEIKRSLLNDAWPNKLIYRFWNVKLKWTGSRWR